MAVYVVLDFIEITAEYPEMTQQLIAGQPAAETYNYLVTVETLHALQCVQYDGSRL